MPIVVLNARAFFDMILKTRITRNVGVVALGSFSAGSGSRPHG